MLSLGALAHSSPMGPTKERTIYYSAHRRAEKISWMCYQMAMTKPAHFPSGDTTRYNTDCSQARRIWMMFYFTPGRCDICQMYRGAPLQCVLYNNDLTAGPANWPTVSWGVTHTEPEA